MTNQATINIEGVSANAIHPSFSQALVATIHNKKVQDKLAIMSKEYGISANDIINDIVFAYCFPEEVNYLGIKK